MENLFYLFKSHCLPTLQNARTLCVTEVLYMIDEQRKLCQAWWKCKNCWQRKMENFWRILGLHVAQPNIFHSVLRFKVMLNSPLLTQCFVNCFLLFFMCRTSGYNVFLLSPFYKRTNCVTFSKVPEIWKFDGSEAHKILIRNPDELRNELIPP